MANEGSWTATDMTWPTLDRIHLIACSGMGPLNVELTLEPHVYLHEAELILDCGAHSTLVPYGFKDGSSAAWRGFGSSADGTALSFSIWWRAIANASPGATYNALITVRDARCTLLHEQPGFDNPARTPGRIGPPDNPTDIGHVGIVVGPPERALSREGAGDSKPSKSTIIPADEGFNP